MHVICLIWEYTSRFYSFGSFCLIVCSTAQQQVSYLLRFTVLHVHVALQGSSVCVCINIFCQWYVHEAVCKKDHKSDKMFHSGFIFASYTYILFTASYNYKAVNAANKKLFKLMAKW